MTRDDPRLIATVTGGLLPESVHVQDVECALDCGLHLLEQLAASSEFLSRTTRA